MLWSAIVSRASETCYGYVGHDCCLLSARDVCVADNTSSAGDIMVAICEGCAQLVGSDDVFRIICFAISAAL